MSTLRRQEKHHSCANNLISRRISQPSDTTGQRTATRPGCRRADDTDRTLARPSTLKPPDDGLFLDGGSHAASYGPVMVHRLPIGDTWSSLLVRFSSPESRAILVSDIHDTLLDVTFRREQDFVFFRLGSGVLPTILKARRVCVAAQNVQSVTAQTAVVLHNTAVSPPATNRQYLIGLSLSPFSQVRQENNLERTPLS